MNLHTAKHAFSVGVVSLTLVTTMLRAQKIEISPEKILDLTYDFDATTVYWPNAKSFDWQKEYWDMSPRGLLVRRWALFCQRARRYPY
jgi:hypothetical protein